MSLLNAFVAVLSGYTHVVYLFYSFLLTYLICYIEYLSSNTHPLKNGITINRSKIDEMTERLKHCESDADVVDDIQEPMEKALCNLGLLENQT